MSADIENGLLLNPGTTLRCGDWRDVLPDVECDVMITDPPFSERTEKGFRGGNSLDQKDRIKYGSIDEEYISSFCDFWAPRVGFFAVVFSDHVLQPAWERHFLRCGMYVFPPVPWCKKDAPPRFLGDGPSSSCEWITVARKRLVLPKARVGSRRGWYATNISRAAKSNTQVLVGQKPDTLMQALIRDYTIAGDLVCDPHAGSGSTAIACESLGRRFVGAEIDPETHAKAIARIANGVQLDMFGGLQ